MKIDVIFFFFFLEEAENNNWWWNKMFNDFLIMVFWIPSSVTSKDEFAKFFHEKKNKYLSYNNNKN